MRVALVHEYFCNLGGADKFAQVLHTLFPDAPVYTLQVYDRHRAHEWLRGMELRTSFIQRLPFAGRTHGIFLPLMPYAIEQLNFSGYDLILSSSSFIAKGIIPPPGVPHLSYTHTRARLAWDLETEYVGALPRPLQLFARAYMHQLRQWDVTAAQRVDQFIANSNFVARRIKQLYRREAVVIYPPLYFQPGVSSDAPRGNYYLAIGRLVKYKRFDLAIQACKKLGRPLRVIGDGPERAALEKMADAQVEFLGWQSHAIIREQLAGARALLFGGVEDFGSVQVEAQAMGCPVIAYAAGGLLETVRDGETGIFFDAQTAASMMEAMRRADEVKFDMDVLRANALRFSMESFKSRLLELIARYGT